MSKINKTFSEELVSEWLQLNGWHVQTGVPLGSKKAGGRDEADIIGLKIIEGYPHVLHVEVGAMGNSFKDNLDRMKKKFLKEKQDYILETMGLDASDVKIQKRYIATYFSSNLELMQSQADENGFRLDMLVDVIQDEMLPDIVKWKLGVEGRITSQLPTPPGNLWLIQLIDYMAVCGVDLSPYRGVKSKKTRKYILTKSGVKVYRKSRYHPALANRDISHSDFKRKEKEVFSIGKAKGLPKIFSENSEDAQTWLFFSPMIKASPKDKEKWLSGFLYKALGKTPILKSENLGKSKILFWRGKEAEPYYSPPPTYPHKEGKTEVDVTVLIPEEAIIFIEAKYKSPISERTTHDPNRDQIIRNLDVGSYFALNKQVDFYFILLTKKGDHNSRKVFNYYADNPKHILEKIPYRTEIKDPTYLPNRMGHITWNELPLPIQ